MESNNPNPARPLLERTELLEPTLLPMSQDTPDTDMIETVSSYPTDTDERMRIIRLVREHFGKTPDKMTTIFQSIYGNDFKQISFEELAGRIRLLSEFMNVVRWMFENLNVEQEVLYNFQGRFEQIPLKLFNYITVHQTGITIRTDEGTVVLERLNSKLQHVIAVTYSRSVIRKKLREIVRHDIEFTDLDYATISREFDISMADARSIVSMLKSCFDSAGRFNRTIFEKNIPEFIKYEKNIFEFMWYYLKETLNRNDRVAFLNSLQLLIGNLRHPRKAIRTLIMDFLSNPSITSFSDRNAIILCNLLVRKYNKEVNLSIEQTPEEVLLVRDGLNDEITRDLAKAIDIHRDRLIKKMDTIYKDLLQTLDTRRLDVHPMTLRYLISLEREIYIFLSLVGGKTSGEILLNALKRYGDPKSEIYNFPKTRENILTILQHLKVLVRAVGRIGGEDEIHVLEMVSWGERGFLRFSDNEVYKEKVRQVMNWVDDSRDAIARKGIKDSRRDAGGFQVVR